MGSTMAFAGEEIRSAGANAAVKQEIFQSICRLSDWLERNDYRAYDTFDGLNARFVRPLTFETDLLLTVLQQAVRRFPVNLRPILGIRKSHSTKGMGFLARGFLRLYEATGDVSWKQKMQFKGRSVNPNGLPVARAQFFVNVTDNRQLDRYGGGYAVFGKVIAGMDVVDKIKAVKTGQALLETPHGQLPAENVPVENVVIKSIRRADGK